MTLLLQTVKHVAWLKCRSASGYQSRLSWVGFSRVYLSLRLANNFRLSFYHTMFYSTHCTVHYMQAYKSEASGQSGQNIYRISTHDKWYKWGHRQLPFCSKYPTWGKGFLEKKDRSFSCRKTCSLDKEMCAQNHTCMPSPFIETCSAYFSTWFL